MANSGDDEFDDEDIGPQDGHNLMSRCMSQYRNRLERGEFLRRLSKEQLDQLDGLLLEGSDGRILLDWKTWKDRTEARDDLTEWERSMVDLLWATFNGTAHPADLAGQWHHLWPVGWFGSVEDKRNYGWVPFRVHRKVHVALKHFFPFMSKWHTMYDRLVQYKAKEGHCLVSRKGNDRQLGIWVNDQRDRFKNDRDKSQYPLSTSQVELLNSIGFCWGVEKMVWTQAFERLKKYQQEHGHTRVPRGYNDGGKPHLGRWVNIQRYNTKNGRTLNGRPNPEYRIVMLDSIDFT